MGFGTLFFGYFLLLNITYFTFSDLIAALIMAMGLYKLGTVNQPFKNGFYASVMFAVLGLAELIIGFLEMFYPTKTTAELIEYITIPRCFAIAILTLFILIGIENVADEVGLSALARRARISLPFVLVIYAISAVLEVPLLLSAVGIKILAVASAITLIAIFSIVAVNLVTIYKAYMKICMPEDVDNNIADKPSRFEFINKHREHTLQKQREYAEYKLEKLNKKKSKKKKK